MDTPDGIIETPPAPQERERAERPPERPETAPEALDEAVDKAADDFESEGAAFEAFGRAEFERVTGGDIPKEELDADPQVRDAKRELEDVASQSRVLVDSFKGRLAGFGSRLKRWGRAALAGAVISGSAMNVAEAATPPDHGSKLEHVEKGKPGDSVAVRAIETLRADKGMAAQFTPEQLQAFEGALARWDGPKMERALADIAGLDAAALAKEGVKEIRLLSDAELRVMAERDPKNVDPKMKAVTSNDRVLLRASAFVGRDGAIDGGEVLHTVAHESNHAEHSRSDSIKHGEQVRPWDAVLPHGVQEGVTEVLALRGLERLGEKSKDQSYAGGNFAAGFLLDKVVGTRALAHDYLTGGTDQMRAALGEKFGRAGADRILRKHFYSGMGSTGAEPEALSTAVDIIREAKRAGMDVGALLGTAAAEGVVERMQAVGDGEGVVLSKEIPNDAVGAVASAAVEDRVPLTPHAPPVRVHVLSQGYGARQADVDFAALGKKIREGASAIEAARAEFIRANGLDEDFEDDPVAAESYAAAIDAALVKAGQITPGETFNVVVNAADEMRPLRDSLAKATTRAERDAIRQRMADEAVRIARDVQAKIGSAAGAAAR
jgi:hypothetical protein